MRKDLTLNQIAERIDNLKNHINSKFDENNLSHVEIAKSIEKMNQRVNKLELWKAFIVGGIAISGSLLGVIWTVFTFILEK